MTETATPTNPDVTHFAARRRAALLSLCVGVLMLIGKWVAYLLTGSHAILSDALESIVHIAATAFAFASIVLSARPPDPKYPYGYGKISYFSAGFEGGLIFLAALAIFYEAIQGFIATKPLEKLDIGLFIIALASVVNLILGLWLIRQGKRTNSLILEADGKHVLTDSYTSFGVVAGVALVWITGWRWLDPLIAILVGLNIIRTGYHLMVEAFTGLMDRADPTLIERIVTTLKTAREPEWFDLHQLRAWQSGNRVFVDFHLVVPSAWTVVQLHESLDRARRSLRSELGSETEVIIHFDPDDPGRPIRDASDPWTPTSAVRVPSRETKPSLTFPETADAVMSTFDV